MTLPALVQLATEEEYRQYYIENYCNKSPIYTYDQIPVTFYPEKFEHAFYKRTNKTWKAKKDQFFRSRGERIDWIKCILQDKSITPKKGYDKATGSYDNSRRVAFLSKDMYLVVIYINNKGEGSFVTAYEVDNQNAANKILNSPDWEK